MSKKAILLLSCGFLAGAILTTAVAMYAVTKVIRAQAIVADFTYRHAESEAAMKQYRSGKPEVAKYAMEHFVDVLMTGDGSASLREADLAFTYIRLGFLAIKVGDSKEAQEAFVEAESAWQK